MLWLGTSFELMSVEYYTKGPMSYGVNIPVTIPSFLPCQGSTSSVLCFFDAQKLVGPPWTMVIRFINDIRRSKSSGITLTCPDFKCEPHKTNQALCSFSAGDMLIIIGMYAPWEPWPFGSVLTKTHDCWCSQSPVNDLYENDMPHWRFVPNLIRATHTAFGNRSWTKKHLFFLDVSLGHTYHAISPQGMGGVYI